MASQAYLGMFGSPAGDNMWGGGNPGGGVGGDPSMGGDSGSMSIDSNDGWSDYLSLQGTGQSTNSTGASPAASTAASTAGSTVYDNNYNITSPSIPAAQVTINTQGAPQTAGNSAAYQAAQAAAPTAPKQASSSPSPAAVSQPALSNTPSAANAGMNFTPVGGAQETTAQAFAKGQLGPGSLGAISGGKSNSLTSFMAAYGI
jgi:hypothetical protein